MKYGRAGSRGVAMFMAGQVPPVPESMQGPPTEPIHMPAPSIYPLFVALGLALMGVGLVIGWWRIIIIGGATLFMSVVAMGFEYPGYGQESHELEESAPSSGGVDLRKIGIVVVPRFRVRILRQPDRDLRRVQVPQRRRSRRRASWRFR